MFTTRKWWLLLVAAPLLLWPSAARADGMLSNTFLAAGRGTTIRNIGTGISFHKITWTVSGTASACSVTLDTSSDGVTWSSGGAITAQTCTSNGASAVVNVTANYVSIDMGTLTVTAGSSVTVTWNGYVNSPSSGGGVSACTTTGGVAYENGASNTLTCDADLTYSGNGGVLTFTTAANGDGIVIGPSSPAASLAWVWISGSQFEVTSSDGTHEADLDFLPASHTIETNNEGALGNALFTIHTDTAETCWSGSSTGSACITPAAAQGTPSPFSLPTTTGVNGNCLSTNGGNPAQTAWGSCMGTLIDSANFVSRVGGQVMDASYTNTSSTISFPNNDCPTAAQVGDISFGTNVPTTFAGNGTVPVGQGTITATCGGLASGTITVSNTASAGCTPSSSVACDFFWGPDESTPLTNFWSAVVNSPGCVTGVISQPGVYLVQSGQFNANATNLGTCAIAPSTSYVGPSLYGLPGATAVLIVPTPNFVTTTGSGQSCGGGVDTRGCFFSSAALNVHDIGIWGGGQPRNTDTNAFSIADLNGGSAQANVYASRLNIAGWAARAKNSYGIETNSASGAILTTVTDNAAGGIACVGNTPSNGYTQISGGSTCGNGLGLTQNAGATNAGCLMNLGSGVWFSSQTIYGTILAPSATSADCILQAGGGDIFSHQDQIEGVSSAAGAGFGVVVTGGKIHLDQDTLTDSGGVTTATNGIFTTAGTVYMRDSHLVINAVSGDKAIDNHNGGGFIDQGGNTFTTNAGIGNLTWGGISGPNVVSSTCTGTATSNTTLFLQSNFGQAAVPNCTNATASIIWNAPGAGSILGMFLSATHAGVNGSSGLVTLIKNGSNTAATCTFGTTTRCSYDSPASAISFIQGDVFTVSYTTQGSEVLAGLSLQLWVQAQ